MTQAIFGLKTDIASRIAEQDDAVDFSLGPGRLQSGCGLVSQLTCLGMFGVRIPAGPLRRAQLACNARLPARQYSPLTSADGAAARHGSESGQRSRPVKERGYVVWGIRECQVLHGCLAHRDEQLVDRNLPSEFARAICVHRTTIGEAAP